MWFFLGLAVLAVATLCVLFYRGSARWSGNGRVAGVEYKGTSNKGKLQGVVVGAPTRASVEFEVKREGWFDQLGKSLGLSVEGQTGWYRCQLLLQPHLTHNSASFTLSLLGRLEKSNGSRE